MLLYFSLSPFSLYIFTTWSLLNKFHLNLHTNTINITISGSITWRYSLLILKNTLGMLLELWHKKNVCDYLKNIAKFNFKVLKASLTCTCTASYCYMNFYFKNKLILLNIKIFWKNWETNSTRVARWHQNEIFLHI